MRHCSSSGHGRKAVSITSSGRGGGAGRVENGRDISRSVPLRFLHFTGSFSYFRTNSESVRNTGCQIRKRVENGLAPIPIISAFPVFDRDIPFLQIRNILYLQPTNPNKCEVLLNLNGLVQINRETLSTRPPHASASLNPAASLPQCLWSRSPATTRRQATAAEPLLRTSPDRR